MKYFWGLSSVAMSSTFISLPVSIPLAGASVSGMAMVLTKKYQKKLSKVTKLVDIVTSALAVYETSIFKVLNDGRVDEWEFGIIQMLYLCLTNWPMSIVRRRLRLELNCKKRSMI